ncbi:hypothetical protein Q5692_38625 [Microcoleus sp. C2C3]|uniref:hypothetical protein n=1 Tax=unclassified Microcoleus TaxID=2642155 RepID=UPI002FD192A4
MPYALGPMPYALCPMPVGRIVPHLSLERLYNILNSPAVNLIMRSLSVASRRPESIANRSNTIRDEVTALMRLNTTSIGIAN